MPYDRKTELLWNYLSMAQFTDLSKFWGQGPAYTATPNLADGVRSPTITLRTNDSAPDAGNNAPAYHAPSDPGLPQNDSPLPAPVVEELGDIHSRIVATPYIPPSAAADHSGSMPSFGGVGVSHDQTSPTVHVISTTVTTTTTAQEHAAATAEPPAETVLVEEAEPKIYGPSEVETAGTIVSSENTQSNDVVNTLDSTPSSGWSNAGSDHVGDIISQFQQPGIGNGHNFIIDYVNGDMTSLTTVHQLNTIFDNDINNINGAFSAPANSTLGDNSLTQSVESGANSLGNTTVLQGNADLAGYDVLVVTGDLTQVNKIMQINLIDDTDHNTVNAHADISTPYGSASSVWEAAIESGGNVEINVGFIIDNSTGTVYLVGGTYGTFASATQVNVLTNADLNDILNLFHSQEGTGFLGFSTNDVIVSGGDSQKNEAGFIGSNDSSDGSQSSHESGTSAPPSDLTSLLAFANLHPTQEDGNIHVLFVDGNYTIVNLVIQINVIHDADQNTLDAYASGATGSLTGPPEPVDDTATDDASQGDNSTGTDDDKPHDGDDQSAHSQASATDHTADSSGANDHSSDTVNDNATETTQDTTSTSQTADSSQASGSGDTAPAETSGAGAETPPAAAVDTAATNDNGTQAGSDAALPVYNDHSSLNYDQIVTSGSNDAGNHATIIENGSGGPQLVIVQGHYYEYNEIYQVNILIDSDHNTITSAMNVPVPAGSDHSDGNQDSTHLTTADDVLKSMTG